MRALATILAFTGLALSNAALSAPQYTFINLGTLSGVGSSEAIAINNDGQVTGNAWLNDSGGEYLGKRAFRWEAGKMTDLGCLPSCGVIGSEARAINAAGQVVGTSWTAKGWRAFLSDGVTMTDLGSLGTHPLGGSNSAANAINNVGQVVGYSYYWEDSQHLGDHAFLWQAGQMADLGTPETNTLGYGYSFAIAINDAGQVVGRYMKYDGDTPMGYTGILWEHGMMKPLGMAEVNAINNAGQVVGKTYYGADLGWRAVLYDGQSVIDLGVLGLETGEFGTSRALAINEAGQVVGDTEAYDEKGTFRGIRAFLWENGTMIGLGTLGRDVGGNGWSWAVDVNEPGDVVGYSLAYDDDGNLQGERAFLWSDGEHYNLNKLTTRPTDTLLTRAVAINDQGWIIGNGEGPEGMFGYLLVPVPEPHQYLMLLAGLGLVGAMARRKKQAEV